MSGSNESEKRTTCETLQAIQRCIDLNVPFACLQMPGENCWRYYASFEVEPYVTGSRDEGFIVQGFGLGDSATTWLIRPRLDVYDILALKVDQCRDLKPATIVPLEHSTAYNEYSNECSTIIQSLRESGGKTVLSRILAIKSHRGVCDVIDDYFSAFQHTCRYIYYTPHTGLWFGASPELLIDYDKDSQTMHTMSLAGTRMLTDSQKPWDAKNIEEHRMVTDYILNTLRDYGLYPAIYDNSPLRFGVIEHLCDRIIAYGDIDPAILAHALSPTPALCGLPKDRAYSQILAHERFSRHCYGGWVAVADNRRFAAYVNLRCALVHTEPSHTLYNLYVGGGITAQSQVSTEWLETERKASKLKEIITGKTDDKYAQ